MAPSTNSHLNITDVTKNFGSQAVLKGVNLSVAKGGTTAIVGPSGSGKTTLLRLIAGFEHPATGSISLNGAKVAGDGVWLPAHKRHIGYVAQDGALFPHLSVGQNIAFGLDAREAPGGRRAVQARISELLEMVSLDAAMAKRRPHQLSGGQQQRVALARALAREPELMLLDEPFSALDAGLRVATRRAVAKVLTEAGVTTILVTHDQAEALSFADQVAVMRGGKLAQIGNPFVVYTRPADRATAEFLGDAVILDAWMEGSLATCSLGGIPVRRPPAQGRVQLMLRPEQIRIAEDGPIRGVVVDTDYFGPETTVRLKLAVPAGAGQPAPTTATPAAARSSPSGTGTRPSPGRAWSCACGWWAKAWHSRSIPEQSPFLNSGPAHRRGPKFATGRPAQRMAASGVTVPPLMPTAPPDAASRMSLAPAGGKTSEVSVCAAAVHEDFHGRPVNIGGQLNRVRVGVATGRAHRPVPLRRAAGSLRHRIPVPDHKGLPGPEVVAHRGVNLAGALQEDTGFTAAGCRPFQFQVHLERTAVRNRQRLPRAFAGRSRRDPLRAPLQGRQRTGGRRGQNRATAVGHQPDVTHHGGRPEPIAGGQFPGVRPVVHPADGVPRGLPLAVRQARIIPGDGGVEVRSAVEPLVVLVRRREALSRPSCRSSTPRPWCGPRPRRCAGGQHPGPLGRDRRRRPAGRSPGTRGCPARRAQSRRHSASPSGPGTCRSRFCGLRPAASATGCWRRRGQSSGSRQCSSPGFSITGFCVIVLEAVAVVRGVEQ